jgi:hypothetical protein
MPKKFSIAVGDTLEVILPRVVGGAASAFSSQTFCAIPVSGGTLDVEFSTSPYSDLEDGTATWEDWASGPVTTRTTDSLVGPITAIRASATVEAGVLEIVP